MSRWIAMHCGTETETLLARYPNAFLLLCQIAMRAKWKDCPISDMKAGEAFIGDWKNAGLRSKKAYEVAKKRLEKCGLAVFQGGNKGTRAILATTTIFSLSQDWKGNQEETPTGSAGAANGKRRGTNHTETLTPETLITKEEIHSKKSAKTEEAEAIYQAYPRKIARPEALKAIFKAMTAHAPEFLLERTRAFAAAIAWQERRFIPHPATWFNREQFNDDPKEWKLPGSEKANITPDLGLRKPSAIRGIPPTPVSGELSLELEDFAQLETDLANIVSLYPKREKVAEAVEELAAHVRKGADKDAVAAGTRAIAAIIQRMPGGHLNAYVPSAATFFKNRRWEDDPQTWSRQGALKNGAIASPLNLGGRKDIPLTDNFDPSETASYQATF